MGHKKKIHSLPPLGSTKVKGMGKNARNESLGCLDVQIPDRQRLIGSPAPQALRRVNEKHRQLKKNGSMSDFPTITLSACEDEDDDDEDLGFQRDSVMEVGEVGASSLGSRNSSASGLSMASIGSIVELHRSLSLGSRSGLTPPPRVISMRDSDGNEVVTEWQSVLSIESKSEEIGSYATDREVISKPNLPSLGSSRTGSSLGGSLGHGAKLPNKYPPLEPIKSRERSRRRKSNKT
eukprot:TRINITY_DN10900_c0_g1_i2.p1 TRINITY_DN10900_c0_g1~~TRINITY_DN10900_c0_g1_i2.p1  ORF type:complete len:236 (-),score=75.82 TRINITY_DN10900_c0_g1_i2:65-772(-)